MSSDLKATFDGLRIFLTGFSGLLGKCFVWKVLSTLPVSRIFVLIRGNKQFPSAKERFQSIITSVPFTDLDPSLLDKLVPIEGDLGQSLESANGLLADIDLVIHAAASVNFVESINASIETNLKCTKDLLDFCRIMKPKLFLYISTAYATCDVSNHVTEKIIPLPEDPCQVIDTFKYVSFQTFHKTGSLGLMRKSIKTFSKSSKHCISMLQNFCFFRWIKTEMGDKLAPLLVRSKPNTYIYSKALTENLLQNMAPDLPYRVAIARPTIIGGAWEEPLPGYIDNYNAMTGGFAGYATGVWRVTGKSPNNAFDCIPVDFCVDGIIAKIGFCLEGRQGEGIMVTNLNSSGRNPAYWGVMHKVQMVAREAVPFENSVRYPRVFIVPLALERFAGFIYQDFFAYLYDLVLWAVGSKFRVKRITKKMYQIFRVVSFFLDREWTWEQTSFEKLLEYVSEKDAQIFKFDSTNVDWEKYYFNYYFGVKKFLFKENSSDLSKAKRRQKVLKFFYYFVEPAILIFTIILLFLGIYFFVNFIQCKMGILLQSIC